MEKMELGGGCEDIDVNFWTIMVGERPEVISYNNNKV